MSYQFPIFQSTAPLQKKTPLTQYPVIATKNDVHQHSKSTCPTPSKLDSRISFPDMFMETCMLWRKRSTCQRLQTAAVVVKNNNIISIGYNGVPHTQKHCTTFWKQFYECAKQTNSETPEPDLLAFYESIVKDLNFNISVMNGIETYEDFIASDTFAVLHHNWSDKYELHAELNALLQAETSTHGASLFTFYSPCRQCAKSIISAKIVKVVYHDEYKRDTEGLNLLERSGISVQKI
jgi:dCMP deaminase